MMGHLYAGDGFCDVAVAGVDISQENMDKGITFATPPTLSSGYKIMVSATRTTSNQWCVRVGIYLLGGRGSGSGGLHRGRCQALPAGCVCLPFLLAGNQPAACCPPCHPCQLPASP